MRAVFMGTTQWAATYLPVLRDTGVQVITVVTRPDRRRGRGRKLQPTPVKLMAQQMELSVMQPERVKAPEVLRQLETLQPDILLVVAYGQILSQELLDLPRMAALNVHYSLLPKLRGPAPVQHALLQGLETTGVTLQKIAFEVDSGDVLLQREVPVADDDNAETLHGKLTDAGVELVRSALPRIQAGDLPAQPQDHSQATFAPMIGKADQRLDWTHSAWQLRNRIRALAPRPGAYCFLRDRRLKIMMAQVLQQEQLQAGEPGTIVETDSERGPIVQAGQDLLLLTELQAEGSRQMSGAEWLRGARVQRGMRLGSEVDR